MTGLARRAAAPRRRDRPGLDADPSTFEQAVERAASALGPETTGMPRARVGLSGR
jgi:hypothetical protein